jgi:hypothetical protein
MEMRLTEDPELDEWWKSQKREYLSDVLVQAKVERNRRILGAIQATPVPGGYEFLFGVSSDVSPQEEYRLAAECWDRTAELLSSGVHEGSRYGWRETDGVLWVQLIDGGPFEPDLD